MLGWLTIYNVGCPNIILVVKIPKNLLPGNITVFIWCITKVLKIQMTPLHEKRKLKNGVEKRKTILFPLLIPNGKLWTTRFFNRGVLMEVELVISIDWSLWHEVLFGNLRIALFGREVPHEMELHVWFLLPPVVRNDWSGHFDMCCFFGTPDIFNRERSRTTTATCIFKVLWFSRGIWFY